RAGGCRCNRSGCGRDRYCARLRQRHVRVIAQLRTNAVGLEILVNDDGGRDRGRSASVWVGRGWRAISRAQIVAASAGIVTRIEAVETIAHPVAAIDWIRNINRTASVSTPSTRW